MFRLIPVIDTSNWQSKPWFHTKGTRDKLIVEDEDGQEYYFKTSLNKANKHYPFEFWSEIIATQLGLMLDVPILNYDAAVREDMVGCMSPSMTKKNQELIEGIQYLHAYNSDFDPERKADRELYSFQLIEKALQHSGLSILMKRIIEMIIFDSIIGNQDRHQENWGVIVQYTATSTIETVPDDMKGNYEHTLSLVKKNSGYRADETQEYKAYKDLSFKNQHNFAPIYDSGSSLGRELNSGKVNQLLNNPDQFNAYLSRGKSEIRWHNIHLSHINLVKVILREADYPDTVNTLQKMVNNYSERNFRYILNLLDENIPANFANMKIPPERKELIIRLVNARVGLLSELI